MVQSKALTCRVLGLNSLVQSRLTRYQSVGWNERLEKWSTGRFQAKCHCRPVLCQMARADGRTRFIGLCCVGRRIRDNAGIGNLNGRVPAGRMPIHRNVTAKTLGKPLVGQATEQIVQDFRLQAE